MLLRWIIAHVSRIVQSVISGIGILISYMFSHKGLLSESYIGFVIGLILWIFAMQVALYVIMLTQNQQYQILIEAMYFFSVAIKILAIMGIPIWIKYFNIAFKFVQSKYIQIRHNYAEFVARDGHLPNKNKPKRKLKNEDYTIVEE